VGRINARILKSVDMERQKTKEYLSYKTQQFGSQQGLYGDESVSEG